MASTILTVGATPAWQRTMVFETLVINGVNRSTQVFEYASGKSINAARVLKAMRAAVVTCGFAGGSRGQMLCEDLERAGIVHDFQQVTAPTRQCITVIDRAVATATELVEESLPVDATGWRGLMARVRNRLMECRLCILTGSLPPGAPTTFYADLIPVASSWGVTTILDARGEALRCAIGHGGFIVKLNREELAATVGMETGSEAGLRAALIRAVPPGGAAIVTLGRDGSLAYDGHSMWSISSPVVTPVSAVGSGDAYAAGVAMALSHGLALPEACARGAACGAANALTPLAGHIQIKDLNRLQDQVQVQQLEAVR